MVKANVIPGKFLSFLLGVFIGIIVALGGLVGGGYYVYKKVKVGSLLSLISSDNNWLSDEYAQNTLETLIQEVQNLANGEITLGKISEISPFVGEKLDALLDNVNNNGIVTLDKTALYSTALNQLSSNITELVIVNSTLNSLSAKFGFTLPDMPLIAGGAQGEEIWIYTAVNDNEDMSVDKAISYGDYAYYTMSYNYDLQVTTEEVTSLYAVSGVTVDENGALKKNGKYIYSLSDSEYQKVTSGSNLIYQSQDDRYVFTTDELFEKNPFAAEGEQYSKVNSESAGDTTVYKIPLKYAYRKLYAKAGNEIVLATETDASGAPVTDGSGFKILDEYKSCHLYAQTEVYTEATEDTQNQLLYVKTNGIGDLPVLLGISALSGSLDTNTLTLNKVSDYFGVSMQNDILKDILDVPLAYLSDSMDAAIENMELASVLELNADSSSVMLHLAYGDKNTDYTIDEETGEIIPINPPKTVSEAMDSIDTLKIKDLVNITESSHSLLKLVKNWTLEDLGDSQKINSIALKNIIDINEEGEDKSPQILIALKDATLGEISDKIQSLTLKEMIGEIDADNTVLYALKDCTLDSLAATVNSLAVQDLFADEIYEYFPVGTLEDYNDKYTDLYVLDGGNYVKYDPNLHTETGTALYSPYIIAYDGGNFVAGYENVTLYAYENGEYRTATEITGWKLPEGISAEEFYYLESGAYCPAEADTDDIYDYAELYYKDADENVACIKLIPAKLSVKQNYINAVLFSKIKIAESAGGEYDYANLYYFDMSAQSFKRVETTLNETTGKFTVSEEYANVQLFTHGNTVGVWKYLLTNKTESGVKYEVISSVNNIGSLVENVSGNINSATLRQLYDDGLLYLNPPEGWTDEKILNTEINSQKLGEMTISETINAIIQIIAMTQQP